MALSTAYVRRHFLGGRTFRILVEEHAWLFILALWSLLLFFGLAGGDPFAAGQPERAAPAIALARWLYRTWTALRQPPAPAEPAVVPRPAPRRATESGLHAAV